MLTSSGVQAKPSLVFTTGPDAFQTLVSLVTFSPASHVAIGYGPNLLHATDHGVVYEPREAYFTRKRQIVVAEYEIVPDVHQGLLQCFERLGEPYDVPRIFGLTLWFALRRMWSPLRGLGEANKTSHTCSSFVMLLDPRGERIFEWRDLDRQSVTPSDLFMAGGRSFRRIR